MTDSPSLFDLLLPKRKMKSKIRLIELFAGIGSQAKALKKLGIEFEHHKICEIDKYAIKSYNAIHNTSFETNDITKLNYKDLEIENTDEIDYIMTYSFPCQDLSLAGKRKGMEKGNSTRSGLLWQVERLLTECNVNGCLPQILLMENVRQVITAKGWHDWCAFLEKIGYSNYCEILNGTDFGIPQNRERAFMISILGEYSYSMPNKIKLELFLKDMLEKEVDEKYYLSDKMIKFFQTNSEINKEKGNGFRFSPSNNNENKIAKCITTRAGSRMDDNFIEIVGRIETWHQRGIVYKTNGIAPTICATDFKTPKLIQESEMLKKYNCEKLNAIVVPEATKIRKLTPKECYRLMGFDDEDCDKASKGNSNAQLYKQAGNSIIVHVLMAIFGELFNIDYITKIKEDLKKYKEQRL